MPLLDIAKGFKGLNNTVDPARLPLNLETAIIELSEATNLRFDNTDRPKVRKGQTLRHGGGFHSLWTRGLDGYVGLDDSIYRINPDLSLTGVVSHMTGKRISFCWTPLGIHYANGRNKGILHGDAAEPWVMGEGRKSSPRYYSGPPAYSMHLGLFADRILVSEGDNILRSQPNNYNLFRFSTDFNTFPGEVRMIQAVAGGVYVSDDARTFFLSGNDPKEWNRRTVMECPAMEWSDRNGLVNPKDIGEEGNDGWAYWVSAEGVVFGSPTGEITQPTKHRIRLPSGFQQGAAIMDGSNCIYNMHQ